MVIKRVTCCALLRKVNRSTDIPLSWLIDVEMVHIKYVSKRQNEDIGPITRKIDPGAKFM